MNIHPHHIFGRAADMIAIAFLLAVLTAQLYARKETVVALGEGGPIADDSETVVEESSSSEVGRVQTNNNKPTPEPEHNRMAPVWFSEEEFSSADAIRRSVLKCGNRVIDPGEECDLGQELNGAGSCKANCLLVACGNQILEPQNGEECDSAESFEVFSIDPRTGTQVRERKLVEGACGRVCTIPKPTADPPGPGCRVVFKAPCPSSVDGKGNAPEQATGEASSGASSRMLVSETQNSFGQTGLPLQEPRPATICGNGAIEERENCDSGPRNSDTTPNTCRTTCALPRCGDGVTDTMFGEVCDQGVQNSDRDPNVCRTTCTLPMCGDEVVDGNEECDGGDDCTALCQRATDAGEARLVCGNGTLDGGEQCDDGNGKSGDGCSTACAFEIGLCGNGVLDLGEGCDDGNDESGDGCSALCGQESRAMPRCGNGTVDPFEECDAGERNSDEESDTCRRNCILPYCGDGVLDEREECDDGNENDGDRCLSACVLPLCGDGHQQKGEQCDDGNLTSGDGCSLCQIESVFHPAASEAGAIETTEFLLITVITGFLAGIGVILSFRLMRGF